jgi:adenylyltransferase/sulfurtransferase
VPNFDQAKLGAATVLLIGAGGLGGEVGEGLARKGVGALLILDPDRVQLSNLNRQLFYEEDLYQNKAIALAKNLAREATSRTCITAYPLSFEDAVRKGVDPDADVVVCGVDSNRTRLNVSSHFLAGRPVVFLGVDEIADHGYVFVQEQDGPCFACLFPHALEDATRNQCAKVGAVKDILKVVAGIALYAVDSLLMGRKRAWNFKESTLAGFAPDVSRQIGRRDNCPVCWKTRER